MSYIHNDGVQNNILLIVSIASKTIYKQHVSQAWRLVLQLYKIYNITHTTLVSRKIQWLSEVLDTQTLMRVSKELNNDDDAL